MHALHPSHWNRIVKIRIKHPSKEAASKITPNDANFWAWGLPEHGKPSRCLHRRRRWCPVPVETPWKLSFQTWGFLARPRWRTCPCQLYRRRWSHDTCIFLLPFRWHSLRPGCTDPYRWRSSLWSCPVWLVRHLWAIARLRDCPWHVPVGLWCLPMVHCGRWGWSKSVDDVRHDVPWCISMFRSVVEMLICIDRDL